MAKAPRPGAGRSPGPLAFHLRVRDESWIVPPPGFLPIREKIAVRMGTGLPYEAFIKSGEGTIGEDSLVVIWWLGRRAAGEPNLSFDQAVAQ
ncbi:MAG: hypothetical protein Q8K58_11235, partial [Acidimicrobiales bacterium]|nr:hypothetical protein [Acidimicrobiales bacterium]